MNLSKAYFFNSQNFRGTILAEGKILPGLEQPRVSCCTSNDTTTFQVSPTIQKPPLQSGDQKLEQVHNLRLQLERKRKHAFAAAATVNVSPRSTQGQLSPNRSTWCISAGVFGHQSRASPQFDFSWKERLGLEIVLGSKSGVHAVLIFQKRKYFCNGEFLKDNK